MRDFVTAAERIGDSCYLRTQRARALNFLGRNWRGRADCTHVYRNSEGERIELSRRTYRRI